MSQGPHVRRIPNTVDEFLEELGYWEAEYFNDPKVGTKYDVPYFNNIRPGRELLDNNIEALWIWKDPMRGPKVAVRVKLILDKTNQFRKGQITEATFWEASSQVAGGGTVWQVFCFHIARPHEYPLFDQHTRRAHIYLTTGQVDKVLVPLSHSYKKFREHYQPYKDFFLALLPQCCGNSRVLDRALWKFGKRLKEDP